MKTAKRNPKATIAAKLEEKRWQNPYIAKLKTHRDVILLDSTDKPDSTSCAQIQEVLQSMSRPVILELGSGSGGHLISRASDDPFHTFCGVELRYKRVVRTAEKSKKAGNNNLVLLRTNSSFITDIFPEQSIAGIYVNFPDPWAKKRWKKHRMLSSDSLKDLSKLLVSNGFISFKTDHEEYFDSTLDTVKNSGDLELTISTRDLHNSPEVQENIVTEFESLFLSQSLPIFHLKAKKKKKEGA